MNSIEKGLIKVGTAAIIATAAAEGASAVAPMSKLTSHPEGKATTISIGSYAFKPEMPAGAVATTIEKRELQSPIERLNAPSIESLETNQVYDLVVTNDELAQTGLAVSAKQADYDAGIFKQGYIKVGDHLYAKYTGDDVFILEKNQPGKAESFGDGSVLLTADPSHPFVEAVGKIERLASLVTAR